MKYLLLFVLLSFCFPELHSQTGPANPTSAANNTSTGTNAWANPGNILASDNSYASVAVSGNTNMLTGTNFGFAIGGSVNIDGIQLDIEKKEVTPAAVSVLNDWSTGLSKTISAGTNRCLIVVAASENGNSVRDISGMTYGGIAMTQVLTIMSGTTTGFSDKLEVWMLLDNGIGAASGNTIIPTYVSGTLLENVEFYTSIVFQNVDQITPVYSSQTTASNSSTNPHQLGSAFTTILNGVCVAGVICGNNTTPAISSGGTNTYAVNSSFSEGTDMYISNPSFATSGISVETSTKVCASNGTEQPAFTFAGSVNRASMFGFTLQRARALDNSVFLIKSTGITGTNHAYTGTSWPTTDGYVSYGGATDLWGTTWSSAEINDISFGAALSASKNNGSLNVDHYRITVYTTSTLPIVLLQFNAALTGNEVKISWVTATELNNNYFEVQRTSDGISFETVGIIDGSGTSTFAHNYSLMDMAPLTGTSYYRLKQVDFNGAMSYSSIVAVTFNPKQPTLIYPNPSADGVFTFLEDDENPLNEVAVFSADLKLIQKVSIVPGEKAIISLTNQEDGIYYLIYNENGIQKVDKVQKISKEN